ncbi:MAG TPA: phosphotransferase [Thermoanaerobaculia bacterium]|jgi:aminoglycoside phosphotransferase (APT) family kinase protein|nr:phosphotransferase [Thermoanaerobaculia bacterium]
MDAELATTLIETQFPDLAPASVVFLGEGFDSCAFEVNGAWVFRFPKREDVEEQMRIEARLLPELAPHLPLPVPSFSYHGQSFVGYRKLAGTPAIRLPDLALLPLAKPLGRFLRALHSFPVDDALCLGVPSRPIDSYLHELRTEAVDDFDLVREVAPDAPLDRWFAYLRAGVGSDSSAPRVLTHHDLAAEHVLVDAGTLTGVIDWSDAAISDRASDFAGVFHWGGDQFMQAVLAGYGDALEPRELARARYMAAYRGVADVKFGRETGKPEYVEVGIRALSLVVP